MDAVSAVERTFDFIVIDTPGSDSYLMRLAHSMADTLVTAINDSFLDFDRLGTVDPRPIPDRREPLCGDGPKIQGATRRQLDGVSSDWIVGPQPIGRCWDRATSSWSPIASTICRSGSGFRSIDGFAERVVYREFFPRGLTALDDPDETTLGTRPSMGHVTAREEARACCAS